MTQPPIVAHLADEIRAFHWAEMARRRKHWIAGVPTPLELRAVDTVVAHRLRVTVEDVRKAVPPVATVPATQPS